MLINAKNIFSFAVWFKEIEALAKEEFL